MLRIVDVFDIIYFPHFSVIPQMTGPCLHFMVVSQLKGPHFHFSIIPQMTGLHSHFIIIPKMTGPVQTMYNPVMPRVPLNKHPLIL